MGRQAKKILFCYDYYGVVVPLVGTRGLVAVPVEPCYPCGTICVLCQYYSKGIGSPRSCIHHRYTTLHCSIDCLFAMCIVTLCHFTVSF